MWMTGSEEVAVAVVDLRIVAVAAAAGTDDATDAARDDSSSAAACGIDICLLRAEHCDIPVGAAPANGIDCPTSHPTRGYCGY